VDVVDPQGGAVKPMLTIGLDRRGRQSGYMPAAEHSDRRDSGVVAGPTGAARRRATVKTHRCDPDSVDGTTVRISGSLLPWTTSAWGTTTVRFGHRREGHRHGAAFGVGRRDAATVNVTVAAKPTRGVLLLRGRPRSRRSAFDHRLSARGHAGAGRGRDSVQRVQPSR